MRVIFYCLLAIFIPAAIFFAWIYSFLYVDHTVRDHRILINQGDSIAEIAAYLHESEIIGSEALFKVVSQYYSMRERYIQAGEYFIPRDITTKQVLKMLLNGDIIERKFTVIEGSTVYQVVKKANDLKELNGDDIAASLFSEGTFLPQTYKYNYKTNKRSLLDRIARSMEDALEVAWEERDPSIILENKAEALIVASIVEREALLKSEMPIIASVYLNRLAKGMRLQADPTVGYCVSNGSGKMPRALTRKDLKASCVHNTYINQGLPPTPICNPSLSAIDAVLHPAETDYLFFVSNASGGHWFSKTYKEHVKNVAKYKRIRKRSAAKRKKKRTN